MKHAPLEAESNSPASVGVQPPTIPPILFLTSRRQTAGAGRRRE